MKKEQQEKVIDPNKDTCISISPGTKFQCRNTHTTPLKIIISTMPPWPGADEAIKVEGRWKLVK